MGSAVEVIVSSKKIDNKLSQRVDSGTLVDILIWFPFTAAGTIFNDRSCDT